MLSAFELVAILLVLTASFGWVNQKILRLPNTIGLLVMGLGASLVALGLQVLFPNDTLYDEVTGLIGRVEFSDALLNGMLGFLLFAGALEVNLGTLQRRALVVGVMATVGVVISTAIVGGGFWLAARVFGIDMPLPWALVFGALISPTDPVAVVSTMRAVAIPGELEIDITGESLFNDGVGVVVFTILLTVATGGGDTTFGHVAEIFFVEALGGGALGLAAGFVAYRMLRAIDDYAIEVLISLALVMGTYALASRLEMSGPIATVVAGLIIGNRGQRDAMSDETQRYLFGFWRLIDQILNSLLFLLIGLEVLAVLQFRVEVAGLALTAIPLVLLARLCAVSGPILVLGAHQGFVKGTIPVMTWGGLRGGIAIALALTIPDMAQRGTLLAATYTVVVFSIVVQGLTLARVIKRFVDCGPGENEGASP